MRLAIMQPYFLPYLGYFQLLGAVDLFILYDNIKCTKKGWINRNRVLQNGRDVWFSLPLRAAPDHLDVRDRELAADFKPDGLLNQICGAYRSAPYFHPTYTMIEQIVRHPEQNLFWFLHHSIVSACEHLGVTTKIMISSDIPIDHSLKCQDKVLAMCEEVGATTYVNAIGGAELYSKDEFAMRGIDLTFIQSKPFTYAQFGENFVPWLSILDVMMFNHPQTLKENLALNYELIESRSMAPALPGGQ
jgi:hypothetical protein